MTANIPITEMMRREQSLIRNYHEILVLARAMTPDEVCDMIERTIGSQEYRENLIAFLRKLYDLPDEERLPLLEATKLT